ncbi:MAG: hypothetical protein VX223_10050, partial [Myxococcota bacterium]|nr:hypothetical protein [Myxococcota bacterium]
GCSRGTGLIAAASIPPDGQFLGADINRVALAGLLLSEQSSPFDGETFVKALAQKGVSQHDSISMLYECLRPGILYSPHLEDLSLYLTYAPLTQ